MTYNAQASAYSTFAPRRSLLPAPDDDAGDDDVSPLLTLILESRLGQENFLHFLNSRLILPNEKPRLLT